jgi:predicted RNase H-like nuclease (RuvC/YqgF family)
MARKRERTNLKPITNTTQEKIPVENIEMNDSIKTKPIDSDEDMSLDDYMDLADKDDILNMIDSETDIEKYISEIKELKDEINKYKVENVNLRNKLSKIECNENKTTLNLESVEKIKNLEEENDNLILQNSELEYENARLTQIVKLLQDEKDKKLHVFTPNGYTTEKVNIFKPTYKKLNNGYEDWI